MNNMRRRISSDKFWITVFAAVSVICLAVIFAFRFSGTGQTAVILQDGKEICRVDLSRVTESYTIPLDGNTILVEPGAVCMQSASCPDKLCIKQGTLHSVGRIVCLPNRVVIEIVGGKDSIE